jgi:cytochrome c
MYTTTFNKYAMGLLGVLLLTMALGVFSNAIYAPVKALKPGDDLPGVSAETAAPAAAPVQEDPPLPPLLAKADATKGQSDTKVCQACHNFEKGAGPKVGPPLYGVVGRPVASIAGFSYSDSLKAIGGDWTYDEIFKFLKRPKAMADGTKMSFPGEADPQKRADILAYLQTLSDSPVPFPK